MAEILFREAIKRGLAEALDSNPDVYIMGEDIGKGEVLNIDTLFYSLTSN